MINIIWDKLKKVYANKQKTFYTSTLAVAITLIMARFLGVVKLHILTNYYSSKDLDLFFSAFRLPDFIFEILIAGSIGICFIPMASELINSGKTKKEIIIFAQSLNLVFLVFWFILFLLITPFYQQINTALMPGYNIEQVRIISQMSWLILLVQVPFMLTANVIVAILQTEKQFLIPGLAPVFYNVGIILGVVLFAHDQGLQAALYGVVIGAALYFLTVFFGPLFLGYSFSLQVNLFDYKIYRFFRIFIPRMFSSLVAQIDASVDLALATLATAGSYSAFYLAKNLQILPVSFFGIALAQTALPFFSDLCNQKDKSSFVQVFTKLVFNILFIILPIAVFFVVLRIPITRLLFGGSKFDWTATVSTANTLSFFAFSLPLHTVYYVITRAFFALQDTKTPFIVSVISTIINTILSFVFVYFLKLPVWYLAISFGISINLSSLVLFYLLIKKIDHLKFAPIIIHSALLLLISFLMAVFVWILKKLFDGLIFDTSRTINLFSMTASLVLLGFGVYLYLAWVLLPGDLRNFFDLFSRVEIIKKTVIRYKKFFYPEKLNTSMEEKI